MTPKKANELWTAGIRKILVPTDFSMHSDMALKRAILLAKQFHATITLLHVIESQDIYSDLFYGGMITPEKIRLAAKQAMERNCIKNKLRKPVLRQAIVQEGVAYRDINEIAKKQRADLIVIATHGRTGLAHMLLGSTAERVIRGAPCLVLVVRSKY